MESTSFFVRRATFDWYAPVAVAAWQVIAAKLLISWISAWFFRRDNSDPTESPCSVSIAENFIACSVELRAPAGFFALEEV